MKTRKNAAKADAKTEVRASKIHGRGLFAVAEFRAGDIVGRLKTAPAKRDGKYVIHLARGMFRVVNDMRFINHADRPNAAIYGNRTVAALRKIRPGEEITHHYGWE